MLDVIIRTLKRVKVKLVLKETHIDSYLKFYRIDFLDRFGNWCRLSIFYNETHFFIDDSVKLIGKGRDGIYTDKIINSIELKGTYEDFIKCDDKLFTQKELNEFFIEKLETLVSEIYEIKVDGFSIKEVKFYCMPTLMVFVYFTFNGKRIEPLRIFIGEEITYKEDLVGLDLLIGKLKEILSYEKLFRFN